MKKEEVSYLDIVKKSKGLSGKSSNDEIKEFIDNQKGYRLLKKEFRKMETIIKNLEKKNKKLTELVDELKCKVMKRSKKSPVLKSRSNLGKRVFEETISKSEEKDIKRFVNRIKNNMSFNEYTRTDIKVEFLIPVRYIDKCINVLKSEDFLRGRIIKGTMRYYRL